MSVCRRRPRCSASAAAAEGAGTEAAPPLSPLASPVRPPTPSPRVLSKAWWLAIGGAEDESTKEPLWRVFRRLLALAKPDAPLLWVAAFFMVAAALAELAIPVLVSQAIAVATSGAAAEGAQVAFVQASQRLMALSLAFGVLSGARGYCFSVANQRLVRRLRERLFSTILNQPISYYDRTDVGVLTSRLGADTNAVARAVCTNVNVLARNLLQVFLGGCFLVILSPQLAAASALASALLWAVTLRYGRFSRRSARALQDATAAANVVAEEAFSLSRTVRASGTEATESGRYASQVRQLFDIQVRQSAAYGLFVVSSNSLYHVSKAAALLAAGALSLGAAPSGLASVVTAQTLTTFVMVMEVVLWSSLAVADEWPAVCEALGAGERVLALVSAPPAPQLSAGRIPEKPLEGLIQLVGVSYQYKNRPMSLHEVCLTLKPGTTVALVGTSGSGKSTLASLITRLYDPTEGRVMVDGIDLRDLDAAWFRSQLGVVNQEPRLFSDTIARNIAYGLPLATQEEIEAAARAANAHDFICALPQGYHTRVGPSGLSGGQKQRIAIARALVRKPALLVLDEATSALDSESEALVQSALDAAMEGGGQRRRTCLVIAHRLSTVRRADVIVVLEEGRVVEQGSHYQLLRNASGRYARMVARNFSASEAEAAEAELSSPWPGEVEAELAVATSVAAEEEGEEEVPAGLDTVSA